MLATLLSLPAKVNTLLARISATSANNLDTLATISTTAALLAPASTAVSNAVWTNSLASQLSVLSGITGAYVKSIQFGYAQGYYPSGGLTAGTAGTENEFYIDKALEWAVDTTKTLVLLQPIVAGYVTPTAGYSLTNRAGTTGYLTGSQVLRVGGPSIPTGTGTYQIHAGYILIEFY